MLYGLRSSGAAFRERLAGELIANGYLQSQGDRDIYLPFYRGYALVKAFCMSHEAMSNSLRAAIT